MNPDISVVITCYNLGSYLQEAIESVEYSDEAADVELILVNDGSDDPGTIGIIDKILEKKRSIRYLGQENQGLAKARNNGIKMAKGDYIIPLDADNKIRPLFFKRSKEILDHFPEIDVVHGNAEFFGHKSGRWQTKPFEITEMLLNNYIDACSCFRKSSWEEVNGFDEAMPVMGFEDWDLWLRMAAKGHKFYYVDEVLFDYRVRNNSMLSKAWENRQELLGYMFSKEELSIFKPFRGCLIENRELRNERSTKELIKILKKKFIRRLRM